MTRIVFVVAVLAAIVGSKALAESRYMVCFGGGRAALYYSDVFPVAAGAKDADMAKAFNAFVKAKYGGSISSECHTDLTQASAASDKKIRESSDQTSKFPSKLIETGWAGK